MPAGADGDLKIGNNDIDAIYWGGSRVDAVYIGNKQVWVNLAPPSLTGSSTITLSKAQDTSIVIIASRYIIGDGITYSLVSATFTHLGSASPTSSINTINPSTGRFVVPGASGGTSYTVIVRATNSSGSVDIGFRVFNLLPD